MSHGKLNLDVLIDSKKLLGAPRITAFSNLGYGIYGRLGSGEGLRRVVENTVVFAYGIIWMQFYVDYVSISRTRNNNSGQFWGELQHQCH